MSTIVKPTLETPPHLTVDSSGNATTKNNLYHLSAPASASDPLVITGPGGKQITWLPTELVYRDDAGNFDYIVGSSPSSLSTYQAQATYSRTFPQGDDVFAALNDRLKHWVMLDTAPRAPSSALGSGIQFGVSGQLEGITVKPGTYEAIAQDDFNLPQPVAKDLLGHQWTGSYEVLSTTDSAGNPALQMFMWFPVALVQTGVYPLTIDPTVIVNSADAVYPGGGRNIVRLSDDSIVAAMASGTYDETLNLYRSTDNGQTWSLQAQSEALSGSDHWWAIASSGMTVYFVGNGSAHIYFWAYDVSNGSFTVDKQAITAASGWRYSIAVGKNGTLYVAFQWSSSTEDSGGNLSFAQSTNGGTSWTVTILGQSNVSADVWTAGSIVPDGAGNPLIIGGRGATSAIPDHLRLWYLSSGSWAYHLIYASSNGYGQYGGCAAVDTNGTLHVVWYAYTSAHPTTYNIRYAQSTDGGSTWSTPVSLTSDAGGDHQKHPTIAVNPNTNDLHVFWQGIDAAVSTSYTNIRRIKYDASAGTWGSITTITNNTTANAQHPNSLWSLYNENSSDALRLIYEDAQAGAVQYYTETYDAPPLAPTLDPEANFDATTSAKFSWTFNPAVSGDTQADYQLQIIDSASTVVYDSGKVASTTSSMTLAANTLTNGDSYQWRVNTWNQNNLEGTYSGYGSFNCAAAPSVSITTPAASGSVTTSRLTVGWTYSDPSSNTQQSFRVKLLASDDSTVVEDSGTVKSSGSQYTLQTKLSNGSTYHVQVVVTNSQDITSSAADNSFSVSFTPPTAASVALTVDNTKAAIQVAITQGATATSASTPTFSGTGNGTMSQPTTTNGTTASAAWVVKCTDATAPATFSVTVGGTGEGNATVGTAYTYNGVSFTISAGSTAFATGDTFDFTTTAVPVTSNDIHRAESGSSAFARIATAIAANGTYTDYAAKHGQGYDYYVVSNGNNGTSTPSATVSTPGLNLQYTGAWLHAVNDPAGTQVNLPYYNASTYVSIDGTVPDTEQWTPTATTLQFAGRTNPAIQFGEPETAVYTRGNVAMGIPTDQWPQVKALLKSKDILCFRDGHGRKVFGVPAAGYTLTDMLFGELVSLVLTEVSYSEVV